MLRYTVQAGDTSVDLDHIATDLRTLNGGTISATSGGTASLTLPSPGAANLLGTNQAIVIDTMAHRALSTPNLADASDSGTSNTDNLIIASTADLFNIKPHWSIHAILLVRSSCSPYGISADSYQVLMNHQFSDAAGWHHLGQFQGQDTVFQPGSTLSGVNVLRQFAGKTVLAW